MRQITTGIKTQITKLGCASTTGQTIPPIVVFSGKRFNHELSVGDVPGTLNGTSDSGWMDSELFSNWFSSHFRKHAVSSRPLMLFLDGHSFHYTLELVKTAAEHNVILFCLPQHTTADSQPLDTSCFGPLKIYRGEEYQEFMFKNPGRVITKFQFSKLFPEAWSKGMNISNICSGFRHTGIYPFNPDVVLKKLPQDIDTNDVIKHTVQSKYSTLTEYSSEELQCFETRFENGYNIFTDELYVSWLQQCHPQCAPQDLSEDPLDLNHNDTVEEPSFNDHINEGFGQSDNEGNFSIQSEYATGTVATYIYIIFGVI